jgi:DNA-binding SARP family transcriptional activator/TolB-like protein/Flp pilus assembly protein TadD
MQKRVSSSELNKVVALSGGQVDFTRRHAALPLVRIHLLGQMRASSYRHTDVLPRGRKARAVLACLCLAKGAFVSRARLAAMLWDRVPDFQARASFRQAFRELTVAFGSLANDLLLADRDTVRLDTAVCWIDAVALLSEETGADKETRSKLAELCKGELLEDLNHVSNAFDQWLLNERSGFSESLRNLLEGKLEQAEAGTQPSEREEIARRLITFDPTHERASRILMRALADRQERVQALAEYKRCREALRRAFDVEPSPETRALYEAIRMFANEDDRDAPPSERARREDLLKYDMPAPKRSHRRVGVMPFVPIRPAVDNNLAFSIAQEVAAALARFRWFDVVAPTGLMRGPGPTFTSDVELRRQDLDYVVDGSVSCSRGDYRISVRLLDLTTDATPVWSNTFDVPVDRLDLLDERVTAPIVVQIDPVILYIESQPKRRNEDDDALGCVMRAIPLLYTMERGKYEEAGRLIERALAMEPDNALVLAWAAYWRVYYVGQGWAKDPEGAARTALNYASRATHIDPTNAEALAIYGHIKAFLHKDVSMALHFFDRALELNRNLPFIWALSALSYCYLGDHDTALERVKRCRELTNSLPYFWLFENPASIAYLMKGEYQEAVEIARRVVENTPAYGNGYKPLIAALGHLRRRKEAKRYVDRLLEIEPAFTVRRFGEVYPFTKDSDREHYMEGLRRAGVPEG